MGGWGSGGGAICFNAAHYWELGWTTNQQISITLSDAKEFDLMAIGDIANADTNSLLVIQLLIPDENAQYYIRFVFSKYSPPPPLPFLSLFSPIISLKRFLILHFPVTVIQLVQKLA